MKKKNITIKNTDTLFNKKTLLYLFIVLIFTGFLFRNSLHAEFLSYDDTENVVNNINIQELSMKNITGYFSTVNLYMYTPLTSISYAIDYQIDGLNPFYFKLTNLILHLINVILIYILSFQLFRKNYLSVFLAILFSLHPAYTDTISWISTRSNLLATLFFLLSLIFYHQYFKKNKYLLLSLSFVSFACSLLSKSSGIMLPLSLLLFDYYYQRKFSIKLIIEKIPFFIASFAIGILTLYFRTDSGNTQVPVDYSFFDHFFLICYSLISFGIKSIIPFHLSEIYAYPVKINNFLPVWYYVSPIILLSIVFIIFKLKVMKREIIFGSLFFLFNIMITQITTLEDGFFGKSLRLFTLFWTLLYYYYYFRLHCYQISSVKALFVLHGIYWNKYFLGFQLLQVTTLEKHFNTLQSCN